MSYRVFLSESDTLDNEIWWSEIRWWGRSEVLNLLYRVIVVWSGDGRNGGPCSMRTECWRWVDIRGWPIRKWNPRVTDLSRVIFTSSSDDDILRFGFWIFARFDLVFRLEIRFYLLRSCGGDILTWFQLTKNSVKSLKWVQIYICSNFKLPCEQLCENVYLMSTYVY